VPISGWEGKVRGHLSFSTAKKKNLLVALKKKKFRKNKGIYRSGGRSALFPVQDTEEVNSDLARTP